MRSLDVGLVTGLVGGMVGASGGVLTVRLHSSQFQHLGLASFAVSGHDDIVNYH